MTTLPARLPLALVLMLCMAMPGFAKPTTSDADYRTLISATQRDKDVDLGASSWRRGDAEHSSGATVVQRGDVTFACQRVGQVRGFASGSRYRLAAPCSPDEVMLERCDATRDMGRSCVDDDWSDAFTLSPGQSKSVGDASYAADCDDKTCRVSIEQTQTIRSNPEKASAAGQQRLRDLQRDGKSNGGNFTVDAVLDQGSSAKFNSAYNTVGQTAATGAMRTTGAAGANRIVTANGEDLGELNFTPDECTDHCVNQTTTTYNEVSTCTAATATETQACVTSHDTYSCVDQPITRDVTHNQVRNVEAESCSFSWRDPESPPQRNCPNISVSDSPTCKTKPKTVLCPTGGKFDSLAGVCQTDFSCPSGYELDADNHECVRRVPTCDNPDARYNSASGQCERPVDKCPTEDFSYDPAKNLCVKSTPSCPSIDFDYNPASDLCEKQGDVCPSGYAADDTGQCMRSEENCPSGSIYSDTTGRCEAPRSCPSGYALTGDGWTCQKQSDECTTDQSSDCQDNSFCPSHSLALGAICITNRNTETHTVPPIEGVLDTKPPLLDRQYRAPQRGVKQSEPSYENQTTAPEAGHGTSTHVGSCTYIGASCPAGDPGCERNTAHKYDCRASFCSVDDIGDGWVPENVFDRTYDENHHLVSWKRGYSRDKGWTNTSAPSTDASCKTTGTACTRFGPIKRNGIIADYDCVAREVTQSCETGATANTCTDNKPSADACEPTSQTCRSHREMDLKICHSERGRDRPRFQCPNGFAHDPASNICTKLPDCPTGYKLDGEGVCQIHGEQCADGVAQGGFVKFFDIISETFTDPDGEPVPGRAEYSEGNDILVLNYREDHGARPRRCSVGWNYTMTFRIDNLEQLNEFVLLSAHWNDVTTVFVNGEDIFHNGGSCLHGGQVGSAGNLNIDFTDKIRLGINTLRVRGASGPDGMDMGARFRINRKCSVRSECSAGSFETPVQCVASSSALNEAARRYTDGFDDDDTARECTLRRHTTKPDVFEYDCGDTNTVLSTCEPGAVKELKDEGTFNEQYDDNGRMVAWDQAYSSNDRMVSEQCRAQQVGSSCELVSKSCTDKGPKIIDGVPVERDCFGEEMVYQCNASLNEAACTFSPPPKDCSIAGDRCLSRDPSSGKCLISTTDYICKNTNKQQCNADFEDSEGCGPPHTECVAKDAHGNCIQEKTTRECYNGETARCNSSPSCTYRDSKCIESKDGVCINTEQTYDCEVTETVCEQRESICKVGNDGESTGFQQAVAAYSQVDGMMKGMDSLDPNDVRIMPGKAMECKNTTGGSVAGAKCCNFSADDESWVGASCGQEDKDLAAARKGSRDHYIGKYCRKEINIGFTTICIQEAKTYCVFDSLLARLVHEQGRPQLNAIAGSGHSSIDQQRLSSRYMSDSPGWHASISVQGRRMSTWTWDAQCEDNPQAAYTDKNLTCPSGDEVWVAYCARTGCNDGNLSPPFNAADDSGWIYERMDPEGEGGISIGGTVQLGGKCRESENSPGGYDTCEIEVTSWPAGSNGNADLSMDISWQLFRPVGTTNNWASSFKRFGEFSFQPYQADPGDERTLPDQVPLRVRVNSDVYDQINKTVMVPTQTPYNGFDLHTTPESRLFGECDLDLNWCNMKVISAAKIDGRQWCRGGRCPKKPALDCKGFTLTEFAVLDFDKMDLGEFTRDLQPNPPSTEEIAANAKAGIDDFTKAYEEGERVATPGDGQAVLHATPLDGSPPWDVTLQMAKTFPAKNGDMDVKRIVVDWGDNQTTWLYPSSDSLTRTHTFRKGKGYRVFTITATYYLQDGSRRSVSSKVESYKNEPSRTQQGLGGGGGSASTYRLDATTSGRSTNELPSTRPD